MVPRLEEVGRVQRRGDEGQAQERFSAQFTQLLEERRRAVAETPKPAEQRVDNLLQKNRQSSSEGRREKRRPSPEKKETPAGPEGEPGRRLDVRT
jgi:hypothetical protein